MAASGDITVARDGQGNVKLHPYLVTLVRWCVSCLWSTATVLLHRLMAAPLQPIAGPKPLLKRATKRAAGTDHLHPEPRVDCQVLHQPATHTLDVIFVHGLYGSLGNTWRQGEWRQKYKTDPKKVILRDHSKKTCDGQPSHKSHTQTNSHIYNGNQEDNQNDNLNKCDNDKNKGDDDRNKCDNSKYKCDNDTNKCDNDGQKSDDDLTANEEMTFKKINEKLFKKILPKENDLITEQFYNNTLLDQVEIVDNCETQAKFVRDLFKRECDNNCDNENNNNKVNDNEVNDNEVYDNKVNDNGVNECKCTEKNCEVGCGCICDHCYSSCWPKDWIKQDFPGARVISINYTSDPYLWRPLWIKEHKRLSLHVRAGQMIQQLTGMGVGEKPVVWVGHSKGGLFIKQIYCEAYEAFQKVNKDEGTTNETPECIDDNYKRSNSNNDAALAETIDNIVGTMFDNKMYEDHLYSDYTNKCVMDKCVIDEKPYYLNNKAYDSNLYKNNGTDNCDNAINFSDMLSLVNDNEFNEAVTNGNEDGCTNEKISNIEESTSLQASLYEQSRGFMFYSVPHRGSPLADIKTPVTARSLELLEISKDCPLVLELQSRWLAATGAQGRRPAVRGFVETCRTLMSVLWLRIVSVESADAGTGCLVGVSVDHREICKPSSRHCLLYTELTQLINEALNKRDC